MRPKKQLYLIAKDALLGEEIRVSLKLRGVWGSLKASRHPLFVATPLARLKPPPRPPAKSIAPYSSALEIPWRRE